MCSPMPVYLLWFSCEVGNLHDHGCHYSFIVNILILSFLLFFALLFLFMLLLLYLVLCINCTKCMGKVHYGLVMSCLSVCLSVCMFQHENYWTDEDEIWYWYWAIEDCIQILLLSVL